MELRVGDLVEVRSEAEILATLDERGELDNLPFMPEMLRFCGQRMTVHKVAHKLCDTIEKGRMRRMEHAVHLTGARCDGGAHGGCGTACSLYWKHAWLKKVGHDDPVATVRPRPTRELLPLLESNTLKGPERFSCQATELLRAAPTCVRFSDAGQYVTDVRSGNAGLGATVRGILVGLFNHWQRLSRKLPRVLRIKDGGNWGFVPAGTLRRTPSDHLDLKPGDLVRIKPKAEIIATLDTSRHNRGLGFEEEMARHCGKVTRVRSRVDVCVDERTGELLTMKTPCITLEDVVCAGAYSVNCPREFVPFWREIWLERVNESEIRQ
ncbi:hypothetical protein OIE66_37935 [Nonomuraea sp. NBC_01738]|uniref:hypothetical protein n=1 Tax=Nonomuraea sp. NBC_01738 TaxID=2976003 RepID=UPI002E10C968|nr:hypothetical protein OIE66_37935 [Nonomuraea sp. NBC_01738]